jgi:ABC-2 type transport system ATP-binding protein
MLNTSPTAIDSRSPVERPRQLAVEVHHLTKTYGGKVRALDGLSFGIEAGSVFGLLGPNGAGKSTAVKILSTLSKADAGQALVAGFDVNREPEQVRRVIGVVGQKSGVDLTATGRENLFLQGRLFGMHGREIEQRVDELLAMFGLAEASRRVTKTYSGGMQRKLDLAMGLMQRPRVLFLDEPTTGLDPEARAELWAEIAKLAEGGLTVLLTTHYLEEADKLARSLAIVDKGKVVAEGTPDELKSELRGDAIHIELAVHADEQRIRGILEPLAEISEIVVEGRTVHARAEHGAAALPRTMLALEGAGLSVASVASSRPSLDDVYLRYAGRSFANAEKEDQR